ncbi:MAG: class I SAM-dependent rRNA methyltransferase [Verrucomicrobiota bacterium]
MKTIRLTPKSQRKRGVSHPWVFAGEVNGDLPNECDGDSVLCRDAKGKLLGSGLFNSRSQLVWRRFSQGRQEFDRTFLKTQIMSALELRKTVYGGRLPEAARLVWSDSDNLPGLIVDRYGDTLAVQTVTLGMDRWLNEIATILGEQLSPKCIIARNDAPVRRKEGLPLEVTILLPGSGTHLEIGTWISVGEIELWVDCKGGQKTGLYLDQLAQYGKVANLASGKSVLDTFCNEGGFGLACMKAGAADVTSVDSSGPALASASKNAERNGVALNLVEDNVFDFFSNHKKSSWDVIVLDPPPFAPNRKSLPGALRGYKELNLRAMQALGNDGILATYTCSHHVDHDTFQSMLTHAAADAGVQVRLIEMCSQPLDHPVILGFPESEYLRGCILEIKR